MIKFKKIFIITSSMLLIIFGIQINAHSFSNVNNLKPTAINFHKPPEHSKEELYQDIIMTLLLPNIQSTVDDYYKNSVSVSPVIAPYDISVLNIERIGDYRTFDFLLKLELHPYVGPHLDIGLDHITVRVNPIVGVKVEKYEHIKDYPIPPDYKKIIKN